MKSTKLKLGAQRAAADLGYTGEAPVEIAKKQKPKSNGTEVIKSKKGLGAGLLSMMRTEPRRRLGTNQRGLKRDLSKYVRWPRSVRLQRQKKILLTRLMVPPAINMFRHTLRNDHAAQLLRFMAKYKPETRADKKQRLLAEAKAIENGDEVKSKKPHMLKFGLNHVTELIEIKKAKLVVIAHDVDPIENVVWLPALCRRKEIPFCIVKSKSRLAQLIHHKTCTAIVVDSVRRNDQAEFDQLVKICKEHYTDYDDLRKKWGGGQLSRKSQKGVQKLKAAAAESLYINL